MMDNVFYNGGIALRQIVRQSHASRRRVKPGDINIILYKQWEAKQ